MYKKTSYHKVLLNKKKGKEADSHHTQNKRKTTAYIFLHIGLKENISWARFLQKSANIARRFQLVFCSFLGRKGIPLSGQKKNAATFLPEEKDSSIRLLRTQCEVLLFGTEHRIPGGKHSGFVVHHSAHFVRKVFLIHHNTESIGIKPLVGHDEVTLVP